MTYLREKLADALIWLAGKLSSKAVIQSGGGPGEEQPR